MYQHRLRRTVQAIVFTGVSMMIGIPAIAQTPADNTKVNTRDRAKDAVTAALSNSAMKSRRLR
jgi:hypothetical protein